ncbi:glycoside hydrolase family 15 protein [Lichenicoccus roseus]|uniref:Glycoside hydrolase family 15 protein n=1 Tax=Lichenicoccus roseus TaxID=2683649 RepID=A0A5R9J491_9PROT|nr:glycoside hydrolase family 15 protein [Lichenicoccus roseus]TLU72372.1 glycoside hydrolase family 15 protein [Lichenicoccus roseus]
MQTSDARAAADEPTEPPAYNAISDYGLIGDTHSTALIDRNGSIDWLCWPRHDSPALFLRLLDAGKGGACWIEVDKLVSVSRRYVPETNILETRFVSRTGVAVLTDLMPVHPPETMPEEGPDGETESRLIRLLRCEQGAVAGRFVVRPTFDYARAACTVSADGECRTLFRTASEMLSATSTHAMRALEDRGVSDWALQEGAHACLVLTHGENGDTPPLDGVQDALERLRRTSHYWQQWSAACTYQGPYREAVLRSVLCLKLLTYSPTGAIIAAPTIGLPEAVPGNRNFDYRYSWLRDASFTVSSFVRLGYTREAAEYLRFLRHADPTHGRDLKLMYGIAGPVTPEQTLDHLEGWRGVGPVSIGNGAEGQTQIDIFGEFLMSLHGFLDAVDFNPPQKTNDHLPEAIQNLAGQVIKLRHEPDHGIWEMPGEPHQILHSKGMNRVALECAIAIGRRIGKPDEATLAAWQRIADEIKDEYRREGWNEARGAYTMWYGADQLDASLLRLVLYEAFDAHDPRVVASFQRICAELGDGDLLYRYRFDDGLKGKEATFSACSLWRVGVLALMDRTREATELFERLLERGNDLGLFAEEIDATTGEQRGNFPQAFTHMAIINNAVRLEKQIDAVGI